MTETLRYTPIYKEDLALGTGVKEVTLADGRVVMLHEINSSTLNGAFVNVMDFDAVGDGVHDDTTSINRALATIDPIVGGSLFFPAGKYLTGGNHSLTGYNNLTICGAGPTSVVYTTTDAKLFGVTTGSTGLTNALFRDLTFLGDNPATGTPPHQNQGALNFNIDPNQSATNVWIHHCQFLSLAYGVFFANTANLWITDNYFNNVHAAIQSGSGDAIGKFRIHIQRNIVTTTSNASVTDDSIAVFDPGSIWDISHNILDRKGTSADSTFRPHAILIQNGSSGTGSPAIRHVSITHNLINGYATTDTSKRAAIEIDCSQSTGTFDDLDVSHNIIRNVYDGIKWTTAGNRILRATCTYNKIYTVQNKGIYAANMTGYRSIGNETHSTGDAGIALSVLTDSLSSLDRVNAATTYGFFLDTNTRLTVTKTKALNCSGGSTDGYFQNANVDLTFTENEATTNGRYGFNFNNGGSGAGNITRVRWRNNYGTGNGTALIRDVNNFTLANSASVNFNEIFIGSATLVPQAATTDVVLGTTQAYEGLMLTLSNLDSSKVITFTESSTIRTIGGGGVRLHANQAITFVFTQTVWWQTAGPQGHSLVAQGASFNPSDATTYYFGAFGDLAPSTTAASQRIYIPRAGFLTYASLFINVAGTLGTNETSTVSVRLNNTTDTTLSSAVTCDAVAQEFHVTDLGITVAQGDYVELKWITPTWATNPTTVRVSARLLLL